MYAGRLRMHRKTLLYYYSKTEQQVIRALKWIANNDKMPDYGYTGDWANHLDYCSDRMNGGRAKAILRLMKK